MRIFLLLIHLFLCYLISSQGKLDSLLSLDFDAQKDSARMNTFINISRECMISKKQEIGVQYGLKAIMLAKKIKFTAGIGKAMLFVGLNYDGRNTDSAIWYYTNSAEILLNSKDKWAIYPMDNLSLIYERKSLYPEALSIKMKKLEHFENELDTLGIIRAMIDIGYINDRIGSYQTSISWYRKAILLAEKIGAEQLKGKAMGHIGIAYDDLGIFDSAHYYNIIGLKSFELFGDSTGVKVWSSNIANTYSKQKKWKEAEFYILKSLKNEDYNHPINAIRLINLGKIYLETNRYKEAKNVLDKAIENCEKTNQLKYLSEGYFRLHELYLKQRDYKNSLNYHILFEKYKDSSFNLEKSEQVTNMQVRFDTEQKEKQLLKEINEKQKVEQEKLALDLMLSNRNNIIFILLCLALMVVFSAIYLLQQRSKKANEEKSKAILIEKDKGIKAMIQAQEEERNRIARELHDGIGQQMSSIKLSLTTLLEKNNSPEACKILKTIDDSAVEIRTLSHQMMPRALKSLGLSSALKDLIEGLDSSCIQFHFEYFNLKQRYDDVIEISIYRIAQELLSNAIKHSKAKTIEIQLFQNKENLILMIEDDGIGFDSSQSSKGIGFENIKTRLSTVQGDFFIESNYTQGTRISVKIPLIK